MAFFVDGSPHVTRSPLTALGDALFHRLSGVVASETVVAHVRRATRGPKTVFNCHPFQYGRWVFAHNGDIPDFEKRRDALVAEVQPRLRRFILGETDSEVVFFIFLTELGAFGPLAEPRTIDQALCALRNTVRRVRAICDASAETPATLTLLASDGRVLIATQGGRELHVSTYKKRCADRDVCASLSPACEAPSTTGIVNHFVVSSEPLHGENVWIPLAPGEMVGVDASMRVHRAHVDRAVLPLAPETAQSMTA
nr:MAG: class II glutamine amidotransferase [Pseudomonadota bacterium]